MCNSGLGLDHMPVRKLQAGHHNQEGAGVSHSPENWKQLLVEAPYRNASQPVQCRAPDQGEVEGNPSLAADQIGGT